MIDVMLIDFDSTDITRWRELPASEEIGRVPGTGNDGIW
jgi:hypothetical protein